MTDYADYNPAGAVRTSKIAETRLIPLQPDYFNHNWFEDFKRDFIYKNLLENNGITNGCVISGDGVDTISCTSGEALIGGSVITVATPSPFVAVDDGWYIAYVTNVGVVIYGDLINTTVQGSLTPDDAAVLGYAVKGNGVFNVYSFFNDLSEFVVLGEKITKIETLLIFDILYRRDQVWQQKGSGSAINRRTIQSPNILEVGINGLLYQLTIQQELDLDTAGNWNSSETTYATPANRAGKNFYIYACEPSSGNVLVLVLSADSTYPDDYTADTSRKIGGFHCLCVDVGTIGGHDLTGYLDGDILPLSVWDLLHRALSENEGMVWDERIGKWVDIYLQSGTGTSTVSVNSGTITDTRTWNNHVDDFAAVKKRLLGDDEFQSVAAGSNEETNIAGSADPVTTGGHLDTGSRRMISNIGCEDCCGALQQWLITSSARLDDGTAGDWYDLPGGKGSFYTYGDNKFSNTQLLAGGAWNNATYCGSRSRYANGYRWAAGTSDGARGCTVARVVHL